jgi:hypothetical protein
VQNQSSIAQKHASSLVTLLSLALSGPAFAGIIDPNDFASGSLITGNTPGATITHITHGGFDPYVSTRAVFAIEHPTCAIYFPCAAPTGTNVLWHGSWPLQGDVTISGGLQSFRETPIGTDVFSPEYLQTTHNFSAIRLDFDNPIDYLSVDFVSRTAELFALVLLDLDGNMLGYTLKNYQGAEPRPAPGSPVNPVTFKVNTAIMQRSSADVATVLMGGWSPSVGIGGITYSVPEPGTLALFGLGLVGLGFTRTRRRNARDV